MDSSDQIQIRIFEIHHLSVFWGKGFEKSIFDKRFPNMYDFLTEPMLMAPYFEPLVTYIIPCLSSIYIRRLFFNPYLSYFLYVCSVCLRRFIFQV